MASSQNAGSGARDKVPNDPTDLSGSSWLTAGRRALKEYKADDLQDRAAALTYFGIQSIFPGLLALVSLLGILGKSATATAGGQMTAGHEPGGGRPPDYPAQLRTNHDHRAGGC